jgi:hypothetical protein
MHPSVFKNINLKLCLADLKSYQENFLTGSAITQSNSTTTQDLPGNLTSLKGINTGDLDPLFLRLPQEIQQANLALIDEVNKKHLHCEDLHQLKNSLLRITQGYILWFQEKALKVVHQRTQSPLATPEPVNQPNGNTPQNPLPSQDSPQKQVTRSENFTISSIHHTLLQMKLSKILEETFCDTQFAKEVAQSFADHIMTPLKDHGILVESIYNWVIQNIMYLPLGENLMLAFDEDANQSSLFSKYVCSWYKAQLIEEAKQDQTKNCVKNFLAKVNQINSQALSKLQGIVPPNKKSALVLSVKNGAGGHTAPHLAMKHHLETLGWDVAILNYDEDFSKDDDPFFNLGMTFEDGSPMTSTTISTKWKMQKQQKEKRRIVSFYCNANVNQTGFKEKNVGLDLLKKVIAIRPELIITTLAYHWCWKSLAYRQGFAKTFLVASDVFFHREATYPWYRQKSFRDSLRRLYFSSMTDDPELLDMGKLHDRYYEKKMKGQPFHALRPLFEGLKKDDQIFMIGAPIHPAFQAITDPNKIMDLKKKWGVQDGEMCICLSRGKLGYNSDLEPALESYRTKEVLPNPVVIMVVCGENEAFYQRLKGGDFQNLGPNIRIQPYPLMKPQDFAEIRAICSFDDIKAGGASTFEGWYLISSGSQAKLLLTPGPDLWWENGNCLAMERWNVGAMVEENNTKIPIIKKWMQPHPMQMVSKFPDWKALFENAIFKITQEAVNE